MSELLTPDERKYLLKLARTSIEQVVRGLPLPPLMPSEWSRNLQELGASFVTLTISRSGALRGCIGALEAYQPLAEDVREHALAAALDDPRFPPVAQAELNRIKLEVSRLTAPQPLEYSSSDELLKRLRPHVDGVILKDGYRRATFLPQVWEKLPDPADFLNHLCQKMGVGLDSWRTRKLQVLIYQVEEFSEPR